jgi:hypothetical protein
MVYFETLPRFLVREDTNSSSLIGQLRCSGG